MPTPKMPTENEFKILRLIQADHSTQGDINEKTGIEISSISRAIKKLKISGHIKATKSVLNAEKFGLSTLAFVRFSLKDDSKSEMTKLSKIIKRHKYVQEVHRVAGKFDILVKVRCPTNTDLSQFTDLIKSSENVKNSHTTIVTETFKETSDIYLDEPLPNEHALNVVPYSSDRPAP